MANTYLFLVHRSAVPLKMATTRKAKKMAKPNTMRLILVTVKEGDAFCPAQGRLVESTLTGQLGSKVTKWIPLVMFPPLLTQSWMKPINCLEEYCSKLLMLARNTVCVGAASSQNNTPSLMKAAQKWQWQCSLITWTTADLKNDITKDLVSFCI